MDKDYNGESCVSISFSNFDKFGCKHWDLIEKTTNFGTGECKYAKTWGCGGRARGQRSIQIRTYRYFFVFKAIRFHSAFTLLHLKTCNWSEKSQCYGFFIVISFVVPFWQLLTYPSQRNSINCFCWNVVLIGEICFSLSMIVFEKNDFCFRVLIWPNFFCYGKFAMLIHVPGLLQKNYYLLCCLFLFQRSV